MKKIAFLFLTLALCALSFTACDGDPADTTTVTTTTAPVTTATPAEDFLYEKTNENTVVIQGYKGNGSVIAIPSLIEGCPVVKIDNGAFTFPWCKTVVTCVILPDTLQKIGVGAFEGTAITDIVLPSSLAVIQSRAFAECKALTHITISSDCLSSISFEVFADSGLETVTLAEGVVEIPETAFAGTKIREIVLPSTVIAIKWQAFAGCENLETVVLNEGLREIGEKAFYGTALKELIIPSTVTTLSEFAFVGSDDLHSLRFLGNAPLEFSCEGEIYELIYPDYTPPFTIYYYEGTEGFASPEWNGIPAISIPVS